MLITVGKSSKQEHTKFHILVIIPLYEVHVKELEAMELGWVLCKLGTSITSSEHPFTYLKVLETEAANVEGVIV